MKIRWSFSIWVVDPDAPQRGGVDRQVFNNIASRLQDLVHVDEKSLHTEMLSCDNSSIPRILDAVSNNGIDIFDARGAPLFLATTYRSYEPIDIERCEYVSGGSIRVGLCKSAKIETTDERGIPIFSGALIPRAREFGMLGDPLAKILVARGDSLVQFQESELLRLRTETPLIQAKTPISPTEMVSVLWSDLTLPFANNICTDGWRNFFHYRKRLESKRGFTPTEGPFVIPSELHYTRSSLDSVGPFDIAIVQERSSTGQFEWATLVYSRRFRQFVKTEFGMEMDGIPVRIDEESSVPWAGPYPPGPWAHLNKRPEWLKQFEGK